MERKKLKELLKQKTPKEIIKLYCLGDVYLTEKQLGEVIELKNKGEEENGNKYEKIQSK